MLEEAIDSLHLEEKKAAGAIKTDFILSAEIMTIALAAIPDSNIWMEAATLATVGVGITVAVYGSVALIVKADDIGLHMSSNGRFAITRWLGSSLVKSMPRFMSLLTTVGTAAMLWVGGSIIIHGLEQLGFGWLGHHIHDWAYTIGNAVPVAWQGAVQWSAKAAMDGVFGLVLGIALITLGVYVIKPLWSKFGTKAET